jgi:hypothetical protein
MVPLEWSLSGGGGGGAPLFNVFSFVFLLLDLVVCV